MILSRISLTLIFQYKGIQETFWHGCNKSQIFGPYNYNGLVKHFFPESVRQRSCNDLFFVTWFRTALNFIFHYQTM